jgi:hypothetical protein
LESLRVPPCSHATFNGVGALLLRFDIVFVLWSASERRDLVALESAPHLHATVDEHARSIHPS